MKNSFPLDDTQIKALQKDFLEWYQKERRNLPWRATNDPYGIWISEIMLQQTRVDTVIGYYYRFMEKYPTIKDLAEADEQELLKVWEGLGYYSRARNLQAAAQQIMTDFAGEMPRSPEEIASLKGIGPYTTGAIASIAFQLPEPAIDGNVMRVVSRLLLIDEDIAKPASRKTFEGAMRRLISPEAPGDFNQALMDLGSSLCAPTSVQCEACPLQPYCLAYKESRQLEFPVKSKKAKPKDVYYVGMAIQDQAGAYLLQQRPETGLLAKMWTFPLAEVTKAEFDTLQAEEVDLFSVAEDEELPAPLLADVIWQKRALGEVKHIFTHLRWHIKLFYGREHGLKTIGEWVQPQDFKKFVFPKPQQKLAELLFQEREKKVKTLSK